MKSESSRHSQVLSTAPPLPCYPAVPGIPPSEPSLPTYPALPKVEAIYGAKSKLLSNHSDETLSNQATMEDNQGRMLTNQSTLQSHMESITRSVHDLKVDTSPWCVRPDPYVKRKTRLHAHAEKGSVKEIDKDLRELYMYIDHEMADDESSTALLLAVKNEKWDNAKALLACGVSFDVDANILAWFYGLTMGQTSLITNFKDGGFDINLPDLERRKPALHKFSQEGNAKVVEALIEAGANVNTKDADGSSPLHESAREGHVEVVGALVRAGADVNPKDKNGIIPLQCCAEHGQSDVAGVLINSGANVDALTLVEFEQIFRGPGHEELRQCMMSRYTGNDILRPPHNVKPEILNLLRDKTVRVLNLSSNKLTTLPAEIGNLTSLQQLILRSNELTTLPAEIGNLTSLEKLYLSSNKLTTLPAEIVNLTSLRVLSLYNNELTTLPAEIVNLTSLRVLDLSDNELTTLPAEIGNLTSLQQLILSNNKLRTLPAEIGV